jgi:hypothetical protein
VPLGRPTPDPPPPVVMVPRPESLVCVTSVYIKVTVVKPFTGLNGVRQKGGPPPLY